MFCTGYPVSVSGMITLPVSSSVYQSMVANIQQIHTNGDGTLCITPMQVQKPGHQHSINHINSGSLIGSNCSVAPCISSVNSSFSNVNSAGNPIIANCHATSNSPFGTTSDIATPINCDNNSTNNNNNSNLLELCRVLSQSTNVSNANGQNTLSFNHNLSQNFPNNNNDRKTMKTKKIANRNQFFNFANSAGFSNESNGIDRHFIEQQIDGNKSVHESDTNNNNHSDGNTDNANNDLKCAQILVAAIQEDLKPSKSDNILPVQVSDNETRNIKMECEIDAA